MISWLREQRLEAAREAVRASRATTVLDLGCGDGDLLIRLATEPQIERIVGVDLCGESLVRLRERLESFEGQATAQVDLVHASMTDYKCPSIWARF